MGELNLKSLSVENFKCFKSMNLNFGRLTVLSGCNGSGKSTAIQPLLLLSQMLNDSARKGGELGNRWPLNGELVQLGTGEEVLTDDPEQEKFIEFDFGFSGNRNCFSKFRVETGKDCLFSVGGRLKSVDSWDFVSNLNFIGAMRGSAGNTYPGIDESDHSGTVVGIDGRYACCLYDRILDIRDDFQSKVDSWLNSIAAGARAVVTPLSNGKQFGLKFRDSESSIARMPANVGNGLTCAFPIVVATLACQTGGLVLIDSPEEHLHPKAQSMMGRMLARVAAEREVQIIVETHSDHVLNGIRLAVSEELLKPEELSILFFSGAKEESDGVMRLRIDGNGNLSDWPEGFFDQFVNDSAQLVGYELDALESD